MMSVRKTRSDKGKPRKPAESQREAFCDWFASQPRDEQDGLMRDMALIQRYAPSVAMESSKLKCLSCKGTGENLNAGRELCEGPTHRTDEEHAAILRCSSYDGSGESSGYLRA